MILLCVALRTFVIAMFQVRTQKLLTRTACFLVFFLWHHVICVLLLWFEERSERSTQLRVLLWVIAALICAVHCAEYAKKVRRWSQKETSHQEQFACPGNKEFPGRIVSRKSEFGMYIYSYTSVANKHSIVQYNFFCEVSLTLKVTVA